MWRRGFLKGTANYCTWVPAVVPCIAAPCSEGYSFRVACRDVTTNAMLRSTNHGPSVHSVFWSPSTARTSHGIDSNFAVQPPGEQHDYGHAIFRDGTSSTLRAWKERSEPLLDVQRGHELGHCQHFTRGAELGRHVARVCVHSIGKASRDSFRCIERQTGPLIARSASVSLHRSGPRQGQTFHFDLRERTEAAPTNHGNLPTNIWSWMSIGRFFLRRRETGTLRCQRHVH